MKNNNRNLATGKYNSCPVCGTGPLPEGQTNCPNVNCSNHKP